MEAKADMFISNSEGMMPLHKAAAEGHCTIVEKLIEHGLHLPPKDCVHQFCF